MKINKCLRCKHEWATRETEKKRETTKQCPKCNSPYWNKPIQRESVSKIQKKRERK